MDHLHQAITFTLAKCKKISLTLETQMPRLSQIVFISNVYLVH